MRGVLRVQRGSKELLQARARPYFSGKGAVRFFSFWVMWTAPCRYVIGGSYENPTTSLFWPKSVSTASYSAVTKDIMASPELSEIWSSMWFHSLPPGVGQSDPCSHCMAGAWVRLSQIHIRTACPDTSLGTWHTMVAISSFDDLHSPVA